MAHFAKLGQDNTVLQVVVVANSDTSDQNGNEVESFGQEFCNRLLGGNWVQTSYNANFRKNFAGIGYTYDTQRDAFIPTKPYQSWLLDETTCTWMPPIPYPEDGIKYQWDDAVNNWRKITT
jgi:hypothetical protein